MLFVLIEKVIENLLVEQRYALEVVAAAWLETHDLVDETVRLMRQRGDVLLSLHLLAHVGRVIAYLKLDGV